MTLIAMAVHDTDENQRTAFTERTLNSLLVQLRHHDRLFVIDNGSCQATKSILASKARWLKVITNENNVGTANAINQAWKLREPDEFLVKMDNDVIIHDHKWIDTLEKAILRQNQTPKPLGICALKRKDLDERPDRNDWFKSTLSMTPSEKGQRWIVLEHVMHCMGTVQMYNPRLIDAIGGLVQPGIYGFDDSLAAVRAEVAGFSSAFVPHIEIDHIDPGGDSYTKWKQDYAGSRMQAYQTMRAEYIGGIQSIFHPL